MPRGMPAYRFHKPTGQAVVTLSGTHDYLGKHGTTASRAEYRRLVAEWLTARQHVPHGPGIGQSDGGSRP